MASLFLVGTADTKAAELSYLRTRLAGQGHAVTCVDVGTRSGAFDADVSAEEIAAHHPDGADAVLGGSDRGVAVAAMGVAFARWCAANSARIDAIIGIGGGGGTAIICEGLRVLAYGVPKVMVSTLASGDVAPYVGEADIVMFPAITDLAGLNRLNRQILHNAAHALLGMAAQPYMAPPDARPSIGLSMFGVTTAAVTQAVEMLEGQYDCMVFHATGTGGRIMERLLAQGMLHGLLDLTTTEIADELVGGVLTAGPGRLDAVAAAALPYVGAPGALDMVNFWAPDTVPTRFNGRQFYHHNSNVTLMRTTAAECQAIGAWIGAKLNTCDGPVRFLLPEGGISALDIEGGPFHDAEARGALFGAIETSVTQTDARQIIRTPHHINDPAFAALAVQQFQSLI